MEENIGSPSAKVQTLRARAGILATIRQFFADGGVLEVETPLLSQATVTDPYVIAIPALSKIGEQDHVRYLQTSPEYAMKRLLAAGSGSIYQICKAFRQGDIGKYHNPEFTLLEWYRVGFDHHALMNDMDALLQLILKTEAAERISYAQIFESIVTINPHEASIEELMKVAKSRVSFEGQLNNRNAWLELLFTHCILPQMGQDRPIFIYDFPVSQAALAKIRPGNPPVASRFEVYYRGIELANGFHELQDATEQRKRFENDLAYRVMNQIPPVPLDENLLAALTQGLPDCAGVALGLDRLMMLALQASHISDVLSFDFYRA